MRFGKTQLHFFPSRFPAVYYGFALLYQKLNRYEESKKYTEQGLAYLEKGQNFKFVEIIYDKIGNKSFSSSFLILFNPKVCV